MAALTPDGGEEQDGLEHLAIDHHEGQQEQEPGRAPGQGGGQLVADIDLPGIGAGLAVHPDSDRHQHHCGQQ